jgi:hypothetical protein
LLVDAVQGRYRYLLIALTGIAPVEAQVGPAVRICFPPAASLQPLSPSRDADASATEVLKKRLVADYVFALLAEVARPPAYGATASLPV